MYTFNDYLLAKYNNSILERFEGLCDKLNELLCMPTVIVGLHTGYKNAVSGVEKDIKQITPRCVLSFNGFNVDRNACTSIQTVTPILSVNDQGNYGNNALPYRRLPLNASFNCTIVVSDPATAIRMSEYISMLSFVFPLAHGDEHTSSTLIFSESVSIDHDDAKNDYNITSSLTVNMQVLEPMGTAIDDSNWPLAGVGIQRPDGSWDETPKGEPVIDPETGEPVIDPETGRPLIGNYVEDGWYRLHIRVHIHGHRRWEDCLESSAETDWERPAGAEMVGDIPPVEIPKWNNKTSNVVGATEE